MARRIIISAGHGGTDPGAIGNGYIERDLAIELRQLIVSELKLLRIEPLIDDNKNALSQTLAWLRGRFNGRDILLDIHWNSASNPEAKGTEVIVPDVSSQFERDLGRSIVKVFTDFGFRDRGVKPESSTARGRLGWMRPSAENVLLEVCFISNPTDMKLYQANKLTIANRLAKILSNYTKL